jgi:competence protein ComEC
VIGVAALAVVALAHTGEIRERAEAAMGRGMPEREAELVRGFVLGEDERIDDRTREDFRRSGLSHLLAVSGQNVALLALLALPLLATLGIPFRSRLVWLLGLIVVYVFLAGADPSIQRAGVMGALTVLATLAGRRSSRFYPLALAAIVTLAVKPRIAADVGWQLSFTAVLGILLFATPLREALTRRIGSRGWRRGLVDGASMTVTATIATAPLIAYHFGALSSTTLLANLLALPAVAPAMWLGMLTAAAGQVPGFPVEALNRLNAPLLAYVAQVAAWCGRPSWAYVQMRIGGGGLAASYLALAASTVLAMRLARRRRLSALRRSGGFGARPGGRVRRIVPARLRRAMPLLAAGAAVIAAGLGLLGPAGRASPSPVRGLRVSVLDVGQGDAILLQPAGGPAILVDGGPPGDGLADKLRHAGVERLDVAVATHDQTDHAGGIVELLGRFPLRRLLYAALDRRTLAAARQAGAVATRVAAGSALRFGRLRLDVLWPPPEVLTGPHAGEDPNRLAIVMLVRWKDFSMLLTADAEAEATPVASGAIDVLKVAHHGSEDAGLAGLLERAKPKLAIISVGDGNPFGHPTAATLATLAAHGVRTLRTDRDGTVVLDVRRGAIRVDMGS